MLAKLELSNFKSFSSLTNFELTPITVLCGTNSSGKSSILQSLLLTKQSFESQGNDQIVLLNGKLVHLGNLNNVIYCNDSGRTLKISHIFKLTGDDVRMVRSLRQSRLPLLVILRDLMPTQFAESPNDNKFTVKFEIGLKNAETSELAQPPKVYVESLLFSIDSEKNDRLSHGPRLEMKHKTGNQYYIKWQNLNSRHHSTAEIATDGETLCHAVFANLLPLSVRMADSSPANERFDPYLFSRIRDILRLLTTNYSYIGPLREEPARRYIYEDEVLEIGVKGENAAFVYLKEKNRLVRAQYVMSADGESFEQCASESLGDAVRRWFNFLGISDFQTETNNELIQLTHRASCETPTRVNIADSGFGISQIFPIIVEGIRISPGTSLILEQPEIHLHPRMQMQLADYFISLGLSSKRVILETHSDHIINRLVRRIVEDKDGKLRNMISIYFVRPSATGTFLEKINVDPKNGITNWPEEFFDQTATEQERIMRAIMKNR